jgi:homoserine kinase
MSKGIKVFSPATVANLACGFDILGLALYKPGDEIIVKENPNSKELRITQITGVKNKLPLDLDRNTATFGVLKLLKQLNINNIGIDMEIHKKMPFGSGLGSSAASACAGVFAINEILKLGLEKRELIPFALEGESLASGGFHADNVAPCMLGGIQFIKGDNYYRLPLPKSLHVLVIHQEVKILTKEARTILSPTVALKSHIKQNANLAGLIISLYNSDFDLLKSSLFDEIIEPQRKHLIPNFDIIKETCLKNGSLGCSISGSGPSIFALFNNSIFLEEAEEELNRYLQNNKSKYTIYKSQINQEGTILL